VVVDKRSTDPVYWDDVLSRLGLSMNAGDNPKRLWYWGSSKTVEEAAMRLLIDKQSHQSSNKHVTCD
jgi:hypothetical protein